MSKWNERIVLGMVEVVIYFGHSSERVPKKLQATIEMREYEGRAHAPAWRDFTLLDIKTVVNWCRHLTRNELRPYFLSQSLVLSFRFHCTAKHEHVV